MVICGAESVYMFNQNSPPDSRAFMPVSSDKCPFNLLFLISKDWNPIDNQNSSQRIFSVPELHEFP